MKIKTKFQMHQNIKFGIIVMIGLILSIYVSDFFCQILSPNLQLYIDLEKYNEDKTIQIFEYDKEVESINSDDQKNYLYDSNYKNHEIHLELIVDSGGLHAVYLNDSKVDNIKKISDYILNDTDQKYGNVYCINTNIHGQRHYIINLFSFILFFFIYILVVMRLKKTGGDFSVFIYSKSSLDIIGIKPIITSIIVAVVSVVIHYGCDISAISQAIYMWQNGIDIYQLSTIERYKGAIYYMWPYEGMLLAGYSLPSYLVNIFIHNFGSRDYLWAHAILYKVFNMILCNMIVISMLSYLLETGKISKEKVKKIYLWSIFNPVTFYVAIIFIQLDILPVYFITLGILLLNKKETTFLSAVLLALGFSCKMTIWILIPVVLLLFYWIWYKEKDCRRKSAIQILLFFIILFSMVLLPRFVDTPIKRALAHIPQAERIWYTTIPYVDSSAYFYVTIGALILVFMLVISRINLKWNLSEMINTSLLMIGIITLVFSGTILSTPSFYLHTLPACVIMYAMCENGFERSIKGLPTFLIIVIWMFMPEGDISASLAFLGKEPIFTKIYQILSANGKIVKWQSLLLTVAASAMFSYAVIFYRMITSKGEK